MKAICDEYLNINGKYMPTKNVVFLNTNSIMSYFQLKTHTSIHCTYTIVGFLFHSLILLEHSTLVGIWHFCGRNSDLPSLNDLGDKIVCTNIQAEV